jgi:hypothetical protein
MSGIAGPVFRIDELIPCGCRVRREEGTGKFRLWYCPAHLAAFEMLEALQAGLLALDNIVERGPDAYDQALTIEAARKVRTAVRKGHGQRSAAAPGSGTSAAPKSPFARRSH